MGARSAKGKGVCKDTATEIPGACLWELPESAQPNIHKAGLRLEMLNIFMSMIAGLTVKATTLAHASSMLL